MSYRSAKLSPSTFLSGTTYGTGVPVNVEPMNEEDRLRRWSDKFKQSSSQVDLTSETVVNRR